MTTPEITCEPWVYRVSPFSPAVEAARFWTVYIRPANDGWHRVVPSLNMMPEEFLTSAGEWTTNRSGDIDHDFKAAPRRDHPSLVLTHPST